MRRSGITSRSKWASFSRYQTSWSSTGPRGRPSWCSGCHNGGAVAGWSVFPFFSCFPPIYGNGLDGFFFSAGRAQAEEVEAKVLIAKPLAAATSPGSSRQAPQLGIDDPAAGQAERRAGGDGPCGRRSGWPAAGKGDLIASPSDLASWMVRYTSGLADAGNFFSGGARISSTLGCPLLSASSFMTARRCGGRSQAGGLQLGAHGLEAFPSNHTHENSSQLRIIINCIGRKSNVKPRRCFFAIAIAAFFPATIHILKSSAVSSSERLGTPDISEAQRSSAARRSRWERSSARCSAAPSGSSRRPGLAGAHSLLCLL